MRILMLNRPTAFISSGGDVMQMQMTKRHLENLGHSVEISLAARPNVSSYDLVHVFNMQSGTMPHSFLQISHATQQNKPTVLSTIYWSHQELENFSGDEVLQQTQSRWRRLSLLARNHPRELPIMARYAFEKIRYRSQNAEQQKSCLEMAGALLPNTRAEKELLMRDFDAAQEKMHVIPNAADSRFYHADAQPFIQKFGLQNFVLCVARIEPRKNQLRLLEVLRELELPAVFIGKVERSSPYVQACLKFAEPRVLFIDHLPHAELAPAYAAAKVHVLPSWYETPGISSLEAGLAGANIVSTARGGTREYFENYALYCEPDDTNSIRQAVQQGFETEKNAQLKEHIKANFTWEKVALLTQQAYFEVLKSH